MKQLKKPEFDKSNHTDVINDVIIKKKTLPKNNNSQPILSNTESVAGVSKLKNKITHVDNKSSDIIWLI